MKNTLENAPLIAQHTITKAVMQQLLIKRLSRVIADKIIEAQQAKEDNKAA